MADHVHGDHALLIHDTVLQPLGLQETYYRNDAGYLKYPQLVNSYLDRYGKGEVENVSKMQQVNVASLKGDDGIVATPANMITFLRGLIEGKLLSPQSMQQMMTWVNESETNKPIYGLGMYHVIRNGKVGYGHGGGGIGAGCSLYYFPEKQVYFFLSVNLGTLVPGPLVDKAGYLQDEVIDALLE